MLPLSTLFCLSTQCVERPLPSRDKTVLFDIRDLSLLEAAWNAWRIWPPTAFASNALLRGTFNDTGKPSLTLLVIHGFESWIVTK